MKILRSLKNENLFYTKIKPYKLNETDVSFDFLVGTKENLKVNLTINKSSFGSVDLFNNNQLKKVYQDFCEKFGDNKEYFAGEQQFKDFFTRIAEKVRGGDYELEFAHNSIELNDKIIKLFKHPDLMNRIDDIIRKSSKKGFVREWDNLMTAYCTILSCKTNNPINLDLTGESSVGKSHIVVRACIAFNRDFVDVIIGGSKTAYKYRGELGDDGKYHVDLTNKSIVILESSEASDLIKAFKAIMSHDTEDDVFEIPVTDKNEITGQREVINIAFHGIPSFIMLGTTISDEMEHITRTLRAEPEVSSGKTKEAVEIGFSKWAKPVKHIVHPELKTLRDGMSCLKKYSTFNIFASILSDIFPKDEMGRCRDSFKLIGVIEAITILHQFQRLKYNDFIAVSLEDNVIGLMLIDKMMDATLAGITQTTLKIYDIMRKMEYPERGGEVIPLEEPLILERVMIDDTITVRSMDDLKSHLKVLLNHHLIETKNKGRGNQAKSYRIIKNQDVEKQKLAPLFIERVSSNVNKLIDNYRDTLLKCELPELQLPQKTIISDDDIIKSIFGMNYFIPENINTPIYFVTPKELRDKLFSKEYIFNIVGNDNTTEFVRRKKEKEKEKEMVISGKKYMSDYIPEETDITQEELDAIDEEWERHLKESEEEE